MPSFAFLFRDGRGNDLVAYLESLHAPETQQHIADEKQWHLPADALASANPAAGPQLYDRYCATCHNANGQTRIKWQSQFIESPAILIAGPMRSVSTPKPQPAQIDHFAQIIKFGIPNSDMAGHEYLPDSSIASLSLWLAQNTAQPSQEQPSHSTSGDRTLKDLVRSAVISGSLLFAVSAFAQHQTFTVDPNASQVAWALGGNGHHVNGHLPCADGINRLRSHRAHDPRLGRRRRWQRKQWRAQPR